MSADRRHPSFTDLAAAAAVAGKGKTLRLGAGAAVASLLGLILFGALAGSTGAIGRTSDCVPSGIGANAAPSVEAQSLAATADQVASEMNMPGRAVLIILMTGWQESSMTNLSGGDRDSVGWLQQRPSQGWGTVDEIMDPAHAARSFFTHLRGVGDWMTMDLGDAAQAVQRSAYPDAYDKWEGAAMNLAAVVGADLGRGGDAYGDGQILASPALASDLCGGFGTGSGVMAAGGRAEWPEEQATVCPDPTTGRGCLTPRTFTFVNTLLASGPPVPSISCWDPHAWNPSSDHPRGRACDVPVSSGFPNADQAAVGQAVASWTVANAPTLGVHYVIWSGQIWYADKGWIPYDGAAGLYDVSTPSGGHYDHVHISIW
jgi:hypothetical protein